MILQFSNVTFSEYHARYSPFTTLFRLTGCRPEHLNCRPSTPLGTLATGFCLSAWRDSQLPHIISIFLLTLKFLLLEPLFRC